MKTFCWRDFLFGAIAATALVVLLGATASNNNVGRYAVVAGGDNDTYSVCVTDTWTGETRCQQGGGPKKHSFSPKF